MSVQCHRQDISISQSTVLNTRQSTGCDLLDLFRPWASLTGVGMRSDGGGRVRSNYPDQLSALRRHFYRPVALCQAVGTGSSVECYFLRLFVLEGN